MYAKEHVKCPFAYCDARTAPLRGTRDSKGAQLLGARLCCSSRVCIAAATSPCESFGFQHGAAGGIFDFAGAFARSSALYRTSRGPREAACRRCGQRWFAWDRKIKPVLEKHRLYLSFRIVRYSVTQLRRTST